MVNVFGVDSGVDIWWGYSQLRHRVPYTMVFLMDFSASAFHFHADSDPDLDLEHIELSSSTKLWVRLFISHKRGSRSSSDILRIRIQLFNFDVAPESSYLQRYGSGSGYSRLCGFGEALWLSFWSDYKLRDKKKDHRTHSEKSSIRYGD